MATSTITKDELLENMRSSQRAFVEAVRSLPDDRWPEGCYEEGWTAKDILAHVASIEWTYPKLFDIARGTVPVLKRDASSGPPGDYNQRHVEKQVKDHVQHACQELFERSRSERVEHLVLATTEEVKPLVESALHPDLARALAGHLTADIEAAKPDQLSAEVLDMAVRDREESDRELLEQLGAGLAHGERAVAGLQPVLNALNLHAVEVLMACPDLASPARSCPTCGWLGLDEATCPVDGSQTNPRDDVLEAAVESALDQDAEVRLLDRDEVRSKGSTAALLRFDVA